jgi:hypothetical protein
MSRPFIPAPNTASVEMIYNAGGQTVENVFHVRKASAYSLSDLQAVRALVLTWYASPWRNFVSGSVTLVRVRTKALDTAIAPMEDYAVTSGGAGLNVGGAASPNNVTYCIKLSTGLSGRSARGRWFFIGLNGATVASQVDVSSGFRDSVVGGLNTLRTNLLAGGHTMCITSYRHDKVWRTTAVNYDIVSALTVDLHIDSQRRRLAGRGQ